MIYLSGACNEPGSGWSLGCCAVLRAQVRFKSTSAIGGAALDLAKRSFLFSLSVQNHCSLLLIFISIPLILSDPVQSRKIKEKVGKCIKKWFTLILRLDLCCIDKSNQSMLIEHLCKNVALQHVPNSYLCWQSLNINPNKQRWLFYMHCHCFDTGQLPPSSIHHHPHPRINAVCCTLAE